MVALSSSAQIDAPAESGPPLTLKARVEAFERGLLLSELNRTSWNRSEAARNLGLGRVTLLDKMKKYKLTEP